MLKSSKFDVNVDNDLTEKRMEALNCLHYLILKGKDSNVNSKTEKAYKQLIYSDNNY